MLLAAPALVAVWALAGLYGALGPALVRLAPARARSRWAGCRWPCWPPAARRRCWRCGSGGPHADADRDDHADRRGRADPAGREVRLGGRVLRGDGDRRRRVRRRVPGRDPLGDPAGGAAPARRGAVRRLRDLLPGHGPAGGDRRVPAGARGRPAGNGRAVRRGGDGARGAGPGRGGADGPPGGPGGPAAASPAGPADLGGPVPVPVPVPVRRPAPRLVSADRPVPDCPAFR